MIFFSLHNFLTLNLKTIIRKGKKWKKRENNYYKSSTMILFLFIDFEALNKRLIKEIAREGDGRERDWEREREKLEERKRKEKVQKRKKDPFNYRKGKWY